MLSTWETVSIFRAEKRLVKRQGYPEKQNATKKKVQAKAKKLFSVASN